MSNHTSPNTSQESEDSTQMDTEIAQGSLYLGDEIVQLAIDCREFDLRHVDMNLLHVNKNVLCSNCPLH